MMKRQTGTSTHGITDHNDAPRPRQGNNSAPAHCGRSVSGLARSYQAYLDCVVSKYGISSSHVPLLAYLWEGHENDTQNDIARKLGVDKGTVSRNVASLSRLGLVEQTASQRDSRACRVTLTEAGWALAEPIGKLTDGWAAEVTAAMSSAERDHLLGSLEQMLSRAEALVDQAAVQRRAESPSSMQQARSA